MKLKRQVVTVEYTDVDVEEFVNRILYDFGDYCLDQDSDDEMFEEFASDACDVIDYEDLEANKQEIIEILKQRQSDYNERNYKACVDDAVDFIVESFSDGFWDSTDNIIYGDKRSDVFSEAIKKLYKEFNNDEVE